MNTLKSNYSTFADLKEDLGIVGILDFYENQNKTEQCWIADPVTKTQICVTCPVDMINTDIAVMATVREFTKKEGSFLSLWVYNPSEIKSVSSSR